MVESRAHVKPRKSTTIERRHLWMNDGLIDWLIERTNEWLHVATVMYGKQVKTVKKQKPRSAWTRWNLPIGVHTIVSSIGRHILVIKFYHDDHYSKARCLGSLMYWWWWCWIIFENHLFASWQVSVSHTSVCQLERHPFAFSHALWPGFVEPRKRRGTRNRKLKLLFI